jgi:pyruvate-ferredoxin/flavodoxin oxidoreductase
VQESADLTLIAHRIAELSLNPGLCAQDGFLTSHVIESMQLPERELIKEYLGDPSDLIDSPTPAQRLVFGPRRRRIPELFDFDYPAMIGTVQNQDSYAQGIAAQRPFYIDHIADLTDQAMLEYAVLTGRDYSRVTGHRLEDAEYVIAGQGTVVGNAEAVADYMREQYNVKVGVLNLTMFRPFPADLITRMLAGKRGVVVLERVDQPLAVDPPLLRELRAAMSQAVENSRANGKPPFPKLAKVSPAEMPDFYSGGFGFGSRDLQPGDIIAAVQNMLPTGRKQRQFYLGIDFIRKGTKLPKLEIWQQQLLDGYPDIADLALASAGDVNLVPPGSITLRIHSVGGWGAITMGKNVVMTAFELAGTKVKANPKYGSEKKGQPTTFYATLAHEEIKVNCELKTVDVVLSPDPNVFRHSNPLAGLSAGGVFIIQWSAEIAELWASLPLQAQREITERSIKFYALDGFGIAAEEASDAELRYRMQGAAFMGAFFAASPFMQSEGLDKDRLFDGIRAQMQKKFGKLGERVVEDNLRVIRRGFEEIREVAVGSLSGAEAGHAIGQIPALLDAPNAQPGVGNPGRFWEQVCSVCMQGQDGIADPFAAMSALPAASSTIRDMTNIRFEVPDFIPSKCTGCAQCWTQCPDSAIPGLVNSVDDIIDTAISTSRSGRSLDRLRQVSKNLAKECHKVLDVVPFSNFGETLTQAYTNLVEKLNWDAERRAQLDDDFAAIYPVIAEFPLARTTPFYALPEKRQKGSGGLLAITINPEACKGCNVCVEVCPEHALITIKQDEEVVEKLRRNWNFWQKLPDTADNFINIANLEEGIGALPSLLLKKEAYRSMVGGDGACMGCGEKTTVHLVVATVEALMQSRVAKFLGQIAELTASLDKQARELIGADVDLDTAELKLSAEKRSRVALMKASIDALKDLTWRYLEGPSGRGRAALGIANSTGCSSVWASTYPYNPYPFPWANHLFQDSPSLAIGIFEGQMRKMADAFVTVRRAQLIAHNEYEQNRDEKAFQAFDWRQFTDDEFLMCPPVLSIGGDGAMLDIGFQNLSRLMASGKPIRVLVLDTQVYSNTGGQACTSGYTGQVADMSAYGAAQHGKEEVRKELALIALAHRGTFVLQTSQASASHLIGGVIRGLNARRPAVFNIYTPCPVEHGLPDEWAPHSAKLALESRAFPFMIYDPDAGDTIADCLNLDGNPSLDELWPTYSLEYKDENGETATMDLPLTIADWAATEARFKKQFKKVPADQWNEDMVPFHEYMQLTAADREGKTPFIYSLAKDKTLERLGVAPEIVKLAKDRLLFWSQLRELAGLEVPASVRDMITGDLESEFEQRLTTLKVEYEAKLKDLHSSYPLVIAKRLAHALLRAGDGTTIGELLTRADADPLFEPIAGAGAGAVAGAEGAEVAARDAGAALAQPAPTTLPATAATATLPATATATATVEDDEIGLAAYIETDRCTTCNECTNLNNRMFAYNANKQAYIKDPKAGTFAHLVQAAEKCPAALIHPGTPLNPKEKDLAKWLKRAEPFN